MSRYTVATLALVAPATVMVICLGSGCIEGGMVDFFNCDHPKLDHFAYVNGEEYPDPCCKKSRCLIECSPDTCVKPRSQWDGPVGLWIGPYQGRDGWDAAPDCPGGSDYTDYEGVRGLEYPKECEPCSCEPSTGSCVLPSKLTASAEVCNVGEPTLSFDAPASWDGTCDTTTQVPAGAAKSLTIAPLTVEGESCDVSRPRIPSLSAGVLPYTWKEFARACRGEGWSPCKGFGASVCIPKDEPLPSGLKLCILHAGDVDCPKDKDIPWIDRHVFYSKEVKDERVCKEECTCGPPEGSMCTAEAWIYQNSDNACGGPAVEGDIGISSAGPKCFDIMPPGQPLGSKSTTPPIYIPGTCKPNIRVTEGPVTELEPTTFCCQL